MDGWMGVVPAPVSLGYAGVLHGGFGEQFALMLPAVMRVLAVAMCAASALRLYIRSRGLPD